MAAYSYKEVANREDFRKARDEWERETGNESDGDPGYDGDYWYIAAWLLDAKDAEIAELRAVIRYRDAIRALKSGSSPSPDPLHPNGRCTCAGEGRCEWCHAGCTSCGRRIAGLSVIIECQHCIEEREAGYPPSPVPETPRAECDCVWSPVRGRIMCSHCIAAPPPQTTPTPETREPPDWVRLNWPDACGAVRQRQDGISFCTENEGHAGDHVARTFGANDEFDRWPATPNTKDGQP